jgi:hypothetical protein
MRRKSIPHTLPSGEIHAGRLEIRLVHENVAGATTATRWCYRFDKAKIGHATFRQAQKFSLVDLAFPSHPRIRLRRPLASSSIGCGYG